MKCEHCAQEITGTGSTLVINLVCGATITLGECCASWVVTRPQTTGEKVGHQAELDAIIKQPRR